MQRSRRSAGFLGALALYSTTAFADVRTLDLGPRPVDGPSAVAGIPWRAISAVRALACNDELNFLADVEHGEHSGDWPVKHLIAKAAVLTRKYDPAQVFDSAVLRRPLDGCYGPENDADVPKWRKAFFNERNEPAFERADALWASVDNAPDKLAKLQEALGNLYQARFGDACANASLPSAATPTLVLRPACLMAQIRTVINNEWLGAWKVKDGQRVPRRPGTDATQLPCPTDWALINRGVAPADWSFPWEGMQGVEGDWDMAVLEYTRLTHVLYAARAARPELSGDADSALGKLNQWLLTLRGEPARETYHPFWSCGNPDNSFGTAEDYLEDNDVYNKDLDRSVSGENEGERSFWDDLWKLLRFLIVVAAIAFLIGFALGAAAGAGAGLATGAAAAAAAAGAMAVVIVGSTIWIVGIEETENHLLMQNSAKYLKNKLMMAELRAANNREGFDDIADENDDVREWLLERMQRIVEEDFLEYNAKPYSRYSHEAILNLLDYACQVSWTWEDAADPPPGDRTCHDKDRAVVTAASAVFDLSAAKMALGSNQGRRIIPFRRLVEENTRYRDTWKDTNEKGEVKEYPPKRIMDLSSGADHLVAAQLLWAGTTQHGPDGHASRGGVFEMLFHATSAYRPHELILDLAVDKSTMYEQTYNHDAFERYSSGPGWLLTAGGDTEEEAQGLRFNFGFLGPLGATFTWNSVAKDNDKGVGVPTTLMAAGTAVPRDTYTEFLRFEGREEKWPPDGLKVLQSFARNRCVTGTFACGSRPEIPDAIERNCLLKAPAGLSVPDHLRFIASSQCPEYKDGDTVTANDFFVAVFRTPCAVGMYPGFQCGSKDWGFVEVASADAFGGSVDQYARAMVAANDSRIEEWTNGVDYTDKTFWSVTMKREIHFTPSDEDFDEDCRACGSIVRHESGSRFTINHPRRPGRIFIDLNEETNPIRRGEGGVVLVP